MKHIGGYEQIEAVCRDSCLVSGNGEDDDESGMKKAEKYAKTIRMRFVKCFMRYERYNDSWKSFEMR